MFSRWILLFFLFRAIIPNMAFGSFLNDFQSTNTSLPNAMRTIQKIGNFAEKLNTKLQTFLPLLKDVHEAQSRSGYADWLGYGDGYEMAAKSEYGWLVPIVIVIGLGTLVIPLLGTFMTSMLTQGTINLTAGRRRRSLTPQDQRTWKIDDLLQTVDKAIEKYSKQFNL